MKTMKERFWDKVDKKGPDDCWEWMASKIRGYGVIWVAGRQMFSSRVSWELANGQIPKGMCVLHHCDNPSCVNPAHLFVGTNADNSSDMVKKGRQARGKMNGATKLSEQSVREIKRLLDEGYLLREIAEKYAVCIATIGFIKTGRNWGWLK